MTSQPTSSYDAGEFDAIQVYIDGVLSTEGTTYTISGTTINFTDPIAAGIELKFVKYKGAEIEVKPSTIRTYNEVVTGSPKTSFTMPCSFGAIQVYLNGILCSVNDSYTTSGNVVTFVDPVPVGDEASFVLYKDDVVSPTSVEWVDVTNKPTTVAGYGITDAQTASVPSQSGQSGKFLTTDGTSTSWGTIDLSSKQDVISDLDTIRSGAALGATSIQSHQDISGKADLSGATFTGGISLNGVPYVPVPNTPEAHNCIYRGKEHAVEELSAKVQAEDWSDIFIGDYFKVSFTTDYGTVTDEKMLVAGINYFKNCGDTATTVPHLVMIPENGFGSAQMNSTNVTTGGYKGSAMHTTVLPAIATALKTAIGSSHVVSRRYLLSNTMNSSTASMAGAGYTGASTGWEWVSCDLCLMSEPMVYGTTVFSSSFYDVGDRKQQLPIFALNPQIANTRFYWWLSSVSTSTYVANVGYDGLANHTGASYSAVVRPLLVFA